MKILRNALMLAAVLGATAFIFHGASTQAQAKSDVCKLEITGNDQMQFDKKELKVDASCAEVELTLTHAGKLPAQAMGHNWVLVRTPDANAVATEGLKAGVKNDYVAPNDKRVIAHTKIIGGGEKTSVRFKTSALKKGESYTYLCTFPGHSSLMRGTLIFG